MPTSSSGPDVTGSGAARSARRRNAVTISCTDAGPTEGNRAAEHGGAEPKARPHPTARTPPRPAVRLRPHAPSRVPAAGQLSSFYDQQSSVPAPPPDRIPPRPQPVPPSGLRPLPEHRPLSLSLGGVTPGLPAEKPRWWCWLRSSSPISEPGRGVGAAWDPHFAPSCRWGPAGGRAGASAWANPKHVVSKVPKL